MCLHLRKASAKKNKERQVVDMTYYTQLQLLAQLFRLAKDEKKAKEIDDFAELYLQFITGALPYADRKEVIDKMDKFHTDFENIGL